MGTYTEVFVQFEWGFGHSHDSVPETVEYIQQFRHLKPKSVLVTFENTNVEYYGEFVDDRKATPKLVRNLKLEPDERVWKHLKENPHLLEDYK